MGLGLNLCYYLTLNPSPPPAYDISTLSSRLIYTQQKRGGFAP